MYKFCTLTIPDTYMKGFMSDTETQYHNSINKYLYRIPCFSVCQHKIARSRRSRLLSKSQPQEVRLKTGFIMF
jgi:hypothetical protein